VPKHGLDRGGRERSAVLVQEAELCQLGGDSSQRKTRQAIKGPYLVGISADDLVIMVYETEGENISCGRGELNGPTSELYNFLSKPTPRR
jgi:hypothetical protein